MDEKKNWSEEMQSAYLYRIVAEVEGDNSRGQMFAKLAKEAEKQAAIWGSKLPASSLIFRPDIRARIVGKLIRIFGPRSLRTMLAAMKVRGLTVYSSTLRSHDMPVRLADIGQRHRGVNKAGNLRAAIFGVSDGLTSNAALIMGVAGATAGDRSIAVSGVAGLLAGAFSMAAGEYISVRSQREMFEYQIGLEEEELQHYPKEEAEELALIYEAKGLSASEANHLATTLIADPEKALDTLAREELGLNPDELGSPFGAALSSCFSFAGGALIPLMPYLFRSFANPFAWTIGLTALSLAGIGAALSLFTGRSALWSGARMLFFGALASGITFWIGRWLGASLS